MICVYNIQVVNEPMWKYAMVWHLSTEIFYEPNLFQWSLFTYNNFFGEINILVFTQRIWNEYFTLPYSGIFVPFIYIVITFWNVHYSQPQMCAQSWNRTKTKRYMLKVCSKCCDIYVICIRWLNKTKKLTQKCFLFISFHLFVITGK